MMIMVISVLNYYLAACLSIVFTKATYSVTAKVIFSVRASRKQKTLSRVCLSFMETLAQFSPWWVDLLPIGQDHGHDTSI